MPVERRSQSLTRTFLATLLASLLVAVSCTAETTLEMSEPATAGEAVSNPVASADGDPTAEGTNSGDDSLNQTDTAGSGDSESTGDTSDETAELYDDVRESVVFLSAPDATGTGVVLDGGWILTNAHIVDRFEEIEVSTSSGEPLGVFDVRAVDWIYDVALVGPVPGLRAFERSTSSDLTIGDEVVLVGFPDDPNSAPSGPTFTAGALANRRTTAVGDASWLLIDATIAPGLSGGAAIDADGRLVALNMLEFGEGEFALSLEADTVWQRVDLLMGTVDDERPTSESIFADRGVFEIVDEVGPRRNFGFLLLIDGEGDFGVTVTSDADIFVELVNLGGSLVVESAELGDPFDRTGATGAQAFRVDENETGTEELLGQVAPGVYQVLIGSYANFPAEIVIESRTPIAPFLDVEEGAQLTPGTLVEGGFDYLQDSDRWQLDLVEGQSVTITADGIADTVMAVRLDDELIASADDAFVGLFGEAALAEFVAPATGTYEVEIGTFTDSRWGYLVEVEIE